MAFRRKSVRKEYGKVISEEKMAQDVIFVGEKEFVEIFSSFGLKGKVVQNTQEVEEFVKLASREHALICLSRKFSDVFETLSSEYPELNIFMLSPACDRKTIVKDFKKISEQAAGVDLTGKLTE